MSELPSLTSHLGYWLRLVSNQVSSRFARRLEGEGVTVAEWVVLRELHDSGPVPPSGLAERLGLTRGAVTKLADRLETKALVTRDRDGEDRRSHRLALTSAGKALLPALAAAADANEDSFFGRLEADDRATLERILKQLVDDHAIAGAAID
ncbi:MarR family winged helix-turn-helix transcriptional regulator [Sphingosinithalassobacter sp. CS137]|uniref:MarR family winged helix-turn-helix transcriptional regulator n=1 Tax=Sphingosinithalassobacter sp. CS137 TaxID=2762748 RepID=UPI00165D5889|nr:MarR family transcriptional regulator [Sphingosinithalassobacter sp. CS137]